MVDGIPEKFITLPEAVQRLTAWPISLPNSQIRSIIPDLGTHHLEVICRLSSIVLIDRFDYGIELQLERIPPAWHPDAKNSFRATQI
jgi:hypothetical protein